MDELALLLERTLILVAHPDDEAVGCGAFMQRVREPVMVFATDGAPLDAYFWQKYGSRDAYAELRRKEAREALGVAGVEHIEFLGRSEGYFLDQALYRSLAPAFESLAELIERYQPHAILALTYEGGHPDHDSCSFLASMLARTHCLPVWEFPLYFRSANGDMEFQQRFRNVNGSEVEIQPTPQEQKVKSRMLSAYGSQGEILKNFSSAVEWFRPQAAYDYSQPPHGGTLAYEAWGWPIKGVEVSAAFTEFRHSSGFAQELKQFARA